MNSEDLLLERAAAPQILTVGELNRMVARLLERNFPLVWVGGEMSNVTRAASGHWYFSLKDRDGQVRCVMFRAKNQLLDWVPREGDQIEARVVVGLYAARGEFQLTVEHMRRAGAGSLYEAFLRLKEKLQAEGLFSAERKLPLPRFPRSIGIITSAQAAAWRDVMITLQRRAPHVRLTLYPTPVQGREAPGSIVAAIRVASERALRLGESEVLLLVRGGGSIEDLWAFNDEAVARAIVACRVPIICGVGHETDFTIADFAADVRAPTPSAAAELASPDVVATRESVVSHRVAMRRSLARKLETAEQRLDEVQRRLRSPQERLMDIATRMSEFETRLANGVWASTQRASVRLSFGLQSLSRVRPDMHPKIRSLAALGQRLAMGVDAAWRRSNGALELAGARLALLNPHSALERGYAIVADPSGRIVRDAASLALGQAVSLTLGRGRAAARIERIEPTPE